ncbi:MAG: hypothetical protein PHV42_01240 [Candidatus Pacebacteria bacterium]|nr:hypothetical protein [Candidatus Paceibacterota bacterium]
MTTVINNPTPGENNNGNATSAGAGVVIGAVLVLLVLIVVIVLALPYVRSQFNTMSHPGNPTINVQLPNPPNLNPSVSPSH